MNQGPSLITSVLATCGRQARVNAEVMNEV